MVLYTAKNGVYYNLSDFKKIYLTWESRDLRTRSISI